MKTKNVRQIIVITGPCGLFRDELSDRFPLMLKMEIDNYKSQYKINDYVFYTIQGDFFTNRDMFKSVYKKIEDRFKTFLLSEEETLHINMETYQKELSQCIKK